MSISFPSKSNLLKLNLYATITILVFSISGCSGRLISYDDKFDLQGRTIVFNTSMVYAKNWKKSVANKESYKYNLYLMHPNTTEAPYDHHYKSGKKELEPVKFGMRFKVIKRFETIPWGIQTAFSTRYFTLVLKDENGRVSTISERRVISHVKIE